MICGTCNRVIPTSTTLHVCEGPASPPPATAVPPGCCPVCHSPMGPLGCQITFHNAPPPATGRMSEATFRGLTTELAAMASCDIDSVRSVEIEAALDEAYRRAREAAAALTSALERAKAPEKALLDAIALGEEWKTRAERAEADLTAAIKRKDEATQYSIRLQQIISACARGDVISGPLYDGSPFLASLLNKVTADLAAARREISEHAECIGELEYASDLKAARKQIAALEKRLAECEEKKK